MAKLIIKNIPIRIALFCKNNIFALSNIIFTQMRKCKWVIYTVIIGLIPIFLRIIMCLFSLNKDWEQLISPVDVAFFGLTLNLTNLNELNGETELTPKEKSTFIGYSVIFIVILSAIVGVLYFAEQTKGYIVDKTVVFVCSILLCIVSYLFSNAIMNKLNSLDNGNN